MLSLGKFVYILEEENSRDVSIFKCKMKPDLLNQHRLSGGFHLPSSCKAALEILSQHRLSVCMLYDTTHYGMGIEYLPPVSAKFLAFQLPL